MRTKRKLEQRIWDLEDIVRGLEEEIDRMDEKLGDGIKEGTYEVEELKDETERDMDALRDRIEDLEEIRDTKLDAIEKYLGIEFKEGYHEIKKK